MRLLWEIRMCNKLFLVMKNFKNYLQVNSGRCDCDHYNQQAKNRAEYLKKMELGDHARGLCQSKLCTTLSHEYQIDYNLGQIELFIEKNHGNGLCGKNRYAINLTAQNFLDLVKILLRGFLILIFLTVPQINFLSLEGLNFVFKVFVGYFISNQFLEYQAVVGGLSTWKEKVCWILILMIFNVSYWGMPALTIFNRFF